MPSPKTTVAAKPVIPAPIEADFDAVLAKFGAKDRAAAEKHLGICEAEADASHAKLWRRLVAVMATLSPHSVKLTGQQFAQFYQADGKYRMQVFALEDHRDGSINIYCRNVLEQAIQSGLLVARAPVEEGPAVYRIGDTGDSLMIEQLDGGYSNPAGFYKDMLGWNRKALRVTLPNNATKTQTDAVVALLVWTAPQPAPAAE